MFIQASITRDPCFVTTIVLRALTALSKALAKRLHDRKVCLGCEWHFADAGLDEEDRPTDLATRGLLCYGHLTENWISGPYGRERQPSRPIHVDQLPPALRRSLRRMCFDSLCFAQTPHIQPVEHAPCESWEVAYIDGRGTIIRAIPGKETDYASAHQSLLEMARDFRVEPPPERRRRRRTDSTGQ